MDPVKVPLSVDKYLSPVRIDSVMRRDKERAGGSRRKSEDAPRMEKHINFADPSSPPPPVSSGTPSKSIVKTSVGAISSSSSTPSTPSFSSYVTPTKEVGPLERRTPSSKAAVEGIYAYLNSTFPEALSQVKQREAGEISSTSPSNCLEDSALDISFESTAEPPANTEWIDETKKFAKMRSKIRKERDAAEAARKAEEEEKRRRDAGGDLFIPLVSPVRDIGVATINGLSWAFGNVMKDL